MSNGQPMADLDNAGTWTDYIYANGQKIALAASQKPLFHMHGVRDGNTPNMGCGVIPVVSDLSSGVAGQTIQSGDRLAYDYMQTTTGGPLTSAFAITFAAGGGTGSAVDTSGTQPALNSTSNGQWNHSVSDLSSFAGQQMASVVAGPQGAPYTGYGTWDIWIANAAIVRANGSVLPIFTGQSASVGGVASTCGGNQQTFQTELTATPDTMVYANSPTTRLNTNYYLDDHLGTTQVELSAGGWPLWQGQFTPFGQEIVNGRTDNLIGQQPADGTSMRFKFTGKERDAESGLDYFGARYYASNTGRFMSPDWADKAEPVPYADLTNPQSLNLYSYAGNNPLSRSDADGHFWQELGNLLKYNHYVNNAGLEAALQGDADEARKNISGYTNLNVNGKSPADALKGLSNQQTVDLDRSLTNFFENNMMSSKGTQFGLVIASFGAEGLEARVVSGIEAANGTVITGFTEHGVDRAIGDAAAGTPGARAGTRPQAILDAIKNPTKVTSGVDSQGRPYQVFTGKDARVVVNPASGRIVSVNPLSGAGAH